MFLRCIQQQAERRGGVRPAGLSFGGGQGVEEAVAAGPAVDLPSPRLRRAGPGHVAHGLLQDLAQDLLGSVHLVGP